MPSIATIGGYETAAEDDEEQDAYDEDFADAEDNGGNNLSENTAGNQTVQHHPSRAASQANVDPQSIQLPETPKGTRRPRLHSRFASTRSSYSSRTSEHTSEDDYAIGADYALQTGGGATLSSSTSSRPSQDLMRSISLASIASGITDPDAKNKAPVADSIMGPDRMQTPRPLNLDSSYAATPTNRSPGLQTPTQSVVDRTVNQLKDSPDPSSPGHPPLDTSPGTLGASPINARIQSLALKEQGNIVDKLQKENFKLKMKLYYLEKRLAQVTDEEVKRMINENIELSTYKISDTVESSLKSELSELSRARIGAIMLKGA